MPETKPVVNVWFDYSVKLWRGYVYHPEGSRIGRKPYPSQVDIFERDETRCRKLADGWFAALESFASQGEANA